MKEKEVGADVSNGEALENAAKVHSALFNRRTLIAIPCEEVQGRAKFGLNVTTYLGKCERQGSCERRISM